MSTRTQVIVVILALVGSFAAGRWFTPVKVVTEVKTVEVEKKAQEVVKDTDKRKVTKIVTVKRKDGTSSTTTEVTEDTTTKSDKKSSENDTKSTDNLKIITGSESKVTIMALGGLQFWGSGKSEVFGGSISKPLLGPITLGAFGLSDGVFGFGVGLTF